MTIHESQLMTATVLFKEKRALIEKFAQFDRLWGNKFTSEKDLAQVTIHVDEEPSENFFAISFKANAGMMDEILTLVEADIRRINRELGAMGVDVDTDGLAD